MITFSIFLSYLLRNTNLININRKQFENLKYLLITQKAKSIKKKHFFSNFDTNENYNHKFSLIKYSIQVFATYL